MTSNPPYNCMTSTTERTSKAGINSADIIHGQTNSDPTQTRSSSTEPPTKSQIFKGKPVPEHFLADKTEGFAMDEDNPSNINNSGFQIERNPTEVYTDITWGEALLTIRPLLEHSLQFVTEPTIAACLNISIQDAIFASIINIREALQTPETLPRVQFEEWSRTKTSSNFITETEIQVRYHQDYNCADELTAVQHADTSEELGHITCNSTTACGYGRNLIISEIHDKKLRKQDVFLNTSIWNTPGLARTDDLRFPPLPTKTHGRTQNPKKVAFGTTSLDITTTAQQISRTTQPANNTMVTTSAGQFVDLATFIGDLVDNKMSARDASITALDYKINLIQNQIEADNARAVIRAFRDKEARLAETLIQHDGMQNTANRRKRELAATADSNSQERKHLSEIIEDVNDKMATLQPYIKKVHNSLNEEATLLGIRLNDIPATLDF